MRAAAAELKGEPQMRPTFFGLQIGQSGLRTSQFGLDVTSHNIANVETDGFTRQRVVQTAIVPATGFGRALPPQSQLRVGVGTQVRTHDQIRSEFLDRRFRTENSATAYWTTRSQEMRYLESFFDSVNEETSINHTISNFFAAVKILAGDTVEVAPRTLLRDAGLDLVQQFNTIFSGLVDLQETQNLAIEAKVGDINRIAQEIVKLNKSIYLHEITGHNANDLRDERNLLVDQLSTIIDVDYRFTSDAHGHEIFELSIAGKVLVHHNYSAMLGVREVDAQAPGMPRVFTPVWVQEVGGLLMGSTSVPVGTDINNFTEVRVHGSPPLWVPNAHVINLEPLNMNLTQQSGQLKALMNMRDGIGTDGAAKGIPYYIELMDNLARAVVQEVNRIHRQGWSDHPVHGSRNGLNFFHQEGHWQRINEDGTRTDLDIIQIRDPENAEHWIWVEREPHAEVPPRIVRVDDFDPADEENFEFVSDMRNITAANIRLSDEVEDSASNIAASSVRIVRTGDPEELQAGNNNNIRALHDLFALNRNIRLDFGGDNVVFIGSLDGYATAIRHDVGSTTGLALAASRNGTTLITAMGNQREAVAGVSLDEEMVSLIRFQHAYSGAARVITAMDDALDRLINGTGRVGL